MLIERLEPRDVTFAVHDFGGPIGLAYARARWKQALPDARTIEFPESGHFMQEEAPAEAAAEIARLIERETPGPGPGPGPRPGGRAEERGDTRSAAAQLDDPPRVRA